MTDIWIVFAIIAAIVVLFIWDRLPVIAVCMAAALALWATGILTLQQSLAGFGDPAVIFIAALFVVSARAGGGGRHGLGGAVADPAGGRKPDAADRADDGLSSACWPR